MLFQNKLLKFILLLLFIPALLVSSSIALRRHHYEDTQKKVQIALSYKELKRLALRSGQSIESLLDTFTEQTNITSIALEEETLEDFVDEGRITVLKGSEIINLYRIGHINKYILSNIYNQIKIKPSSIFIIIDTQEDFEKISDFLRAEFGKDAVIRIQVKSGGKHILEVVDDSTDLLQIGLGISHETIEELVNLDLAPIIRLKNSTRLNKQIIRLKLASFIDYIPEALVIFDGSSVLGYPNYLPYTIQKFTSQQLQFGLIEFTDQLGATTIATELPNQVVRVHSISQEEMEFMTQEKAIGRYLRAAKERGIQILFIRPFFDTYEIGELINKNVAMINEIEKKLDHEGLTITASTFQDTDYVAAKQWELLVLSIGVFIALLFFINLFVNVNGLFLTVLFGLFSIGFYISFLMNSFMVWNTTMALLTAIISPPLALITLFPSKKQTHIMKNRFIFSLFYFISLFVLCLVGSLFILSFLSDIHFIKGIYRFAGVKIAYLTPILITGVYFYLRPHRLSSFMYIFKRLYNAPVRTAGLLAFSVCAFLMLILLLRSGNYIHFSTLSFESHLRLLLEQSLSARPRFKEFLIGYPFLFLGYMLVDKKLPRHWLWFFNTLGSFALVSLINSFCHMHTTLEISLQRSLIGLGLGLAVGIVYYFFFNFIYNLYKRITQ